MILLGLENGYLRNKIKNQRNRKLMMKLIELLELDILDVVLLVLESGKREKEVLKFILINLH